MDNSNSELNEEDKEQIRRLHSKLLYTTIAVNHLDPSIKDGLPYRKFKASCRQYLTEPVDNSSDSVEERLDTLERKGLIGVGDYDILMEIVSFDQILLERITDTEQLIHVHGGQIFRRDGVEKKPVHKIRYEDLIMRVQPIQSQPSENPQEIADTLKKLKSINETINEKADELTLSRSKNKEEFNSRHRRHLQKMNESLDILVWFRDEERLSRANAISKYVEKSAYYLLHDSDEFLEFEKDWKERIENWKIESQLPLDTESFLRSKGLNVRKTFVCCVYVFVQCDTVEKLERIWEEYKSESLLEEFRSVVLTRRDPQNFKIVISEENYRSYRDFLGTADNMSEAESGKDPDREIYSGW